MLDWDLIRYFLAVARAGSTLVASHDLKQSQPTVARRVEALEARLGLALFERRRTGYRLTQEGQALLAAAADAEQAAAVFASTAAALTRRVAGVVRLTCGEMVAARHLAPLLAAFREAYPEVQVEVIVSETRLDLSAGEADVAIRGADPTTSIGVDAGLVGRKLRSNPWRVYAGRGYLASRPRPADAAELAGHAVVSGDGALAALDAVRWLEDRVGAGSVAARANTFPALAANIRAGFGLGVLPSGFFDEDSELTACFALPDETAGQVWLVTHERVRDLPRVRALLDFTAAYMTGRLVTPPHPSSSGT